MKLLNKQKYFNGNCNRILNILQVGLAIEYPQINFPLHPEWRLWARKIKEASKETPQRNTRTELSENSTFSKFFLINLGFMQPILKLV
jgi:hypothetical protein